MSPQSEEFSLRRARLLTLCVLVVVAAGIALANLSSELVSSDFLIHSMHNEEPAERAYGWPLGWYWQIYTFRPYVVRTPAEYFRPFTGFWQNLTPPWKPQGVVSRYSAVRLAANLAIWLVIMAVTRAGCLRLRRRSWPRLRGRPWVTTPLVLTIVSALTLLSNLSCDALPERGPRGQFSYGWPMIWFRYIDQPNMVATARVWDYSAAALAGDLAAWVVILAATGLAWQWLLHRHPPRLRWSLRTMLAGVTLAGALCAWYVTARDRAMQEDALLASIGGDDDNAYKVYFERWGPKWLDLVGADRLRRRIVAVRLTAEDMNDEVFERLAPLRSLRLLDITPTLYHRPFVFTPSMAASLGEMRQLRMLKVDCHGDDLAESQVATRECLTAIGKLTQLERLRVDLWEESNDDLGPLTGLTKLKTLTLQIFPFASDDDPKEIEREEEARTLARLPVLPRLQALDLDEWEIGDEDLGRLVGFPRLK